MAASTRDRKTLAYLLAPHSVDEFLNEHVQQKPLHVRRNAQGYYERFFSLRELERVLFGCKLTTDELRVIKDGTPVRPETYTWQPPDKYRGPEVTRASTTIDADRVSAQFAHGCTVNMNAVERYSPSAASLARALATFFYTGVGANVYLTPAGNQGFGAHYDTHDTLILQLEGSKRWRISEPTMPLPLDHQIYNKIGHTKPGPLLFEVDLLPGDLLYLPAGTFHEGKANDELSLHITYSLAPPRWVHVAIESLMRAAESDVRLRRNAGAETSVVGEALAEALAPEKLRGVLEAMRSELFSTYRGDLDGQLRQIGDLGKLSELSYVAKRGSVIYELRETAHGVQLSFAGKSLSLPASAKAIVNELDNVSELQVSALLRHDEKALGIVRRLIQEGFAVQCSPPTGHGESVA